LFSKAIFLIGLLAGIYAFLMWKTPGGWLGAGLCALMGLVIATIGFNVMHDGGHGSFSKWPWLNKLAALTLNVLGGSAFMWNQKHNNIHHAYTNVHEMDDDLDAGMLLRLTEHQKLRWFHRMQAVYFPFLYALLYLFWIFVSDYKKYFRKRIGSTPLKEMKLKDHLSFWFGKFLTLSIFVIIPMARFGFVPWILGFLIMAAVSGFILSIVFQLAHTVEATHFPLPEEHSGRMEDEWAVHQLKTTANFATRNKLIGWLVGGLNFQVEHHLFPRISHIHYPAINQIVRQACAEFGVPYLEYPTMRSAIASHVRYLHKLGNGA